MKLHELKVLHRNQPVIDEMPEFSWKIESDAQNKFDQKLSLATRIAGKVSDYCKRCAKDCVGFRDCRIAKTEFYQIPGRYAGILCGLHLECQSLG